MDQASIDRLMRDLIERETRSLGFGTPLTPPALRAPRSCKHKPTQGEWLSWAHACKCLGVRHDELFQLAQANQVRYRIAGRKHQHLQVWTRDLVDRWPESFADYAGRLAIVRARASGPAA